MTRRKFNYLHIICIAITLGFVAWGVFGFSSAFVRIIESGRDFGLSAAFFFCKVFGIETSITPTVNELPQVMPPFTAIFLPETWVGFQANWAAYWQLWASKDNVLMYLLHLGKVLFVMLEIVVVALPFVLLLRLLFSMYLKKHNNDYDKDSRALIAFKWLAAHIYTPVKTWLVGLFAFIKAHRAYWLVWLFLWLFYFNAATIVLEFIAYYLYFVVAFDVANIYIQVYKLFLDLSAVFSFVPLWVWALIALVVLDKLRKKIALARLHHFEMRNRGFINARPIAYMVCATMGAGKTKVVTDMSMSQEVMYRDKAFEKILENDLKFPFFPWCNLENELKRAMEYHEIYNLATIRRFVRKKFLRWQKMPCRERLFNYDYERYGFTYDDKLKVVDVWEIVEIYAQLYFIYIIRSSLLLANYSIRVDNILQDLGNFPLWHSDFFQSDSRLIDAYSRHAHIIDFDALRLGLKVLENNAFADSFEFGIIAITEIGKERGNTLELQGIKKTADTANQKNDNFNAMLKMIRHPSTIDNFPFARLITDEQRPESWGADARDLCEIVHIREKGETRLAMPFFSLGELLYGWLFGRFTGLYYQYRFIRSDNTLPMYLLKGLMAKLHHYYTRIYNRFGYYTLQLEVERGTQDGIVAQSKYYIMSKKIHSRRYSTDSFADIFNEKALRSPVGINDLPEYGTEKATFEELQAQNSYFVNDLLDGLFRGN